MTTDNALQYRGAVLYADFSDSTPSEKAETPIFYNERRDISAFVEGNGGLTVEITARHLYGLFPLSVQALEAARKIRRHALKIRGSEPGRKGLSCRLLLGFGEVVVENGRLRGDWTHRLSGLVSQVPEFAIAGLADYVAELQQQGLRKISEAAGLYLISNAGDEATDNPQTRHASAMLKADSAVFTELRLSVGGKPRMVRNAECPLLLGRDKSCGVIVSGDTVSRIHGRIGYESGKFFYADESTNGTYVLTASGEEVFLHKERIVLLGEGAISPGAPLSRQTTAVVRYSCSSSRLSMADDRSGDTRRLSPKP
jgi:pSer/pThr/pTyr-binding forkhead associated (FHA) protein